MIHYENIKTFVRDTLGCGCPEEVFHYIDCQYDIKLNDMVLRNKLNIGNRLLIYIVEVDDQDSLKDILPFLIEIGKKERDGLGFNRFRLVLTTNTVNEIKEVAETVFKDTAQDEKVHLHLVLKESIPDFTKPCP